MTILLFMLVIHHVNRTAAFDVTCPQPSERYLRSRSKCLDYRNYTCLFDENQNSFSESCSVKFDFQRPGYKVTVRTNLHAGVCADTLYQPFIFFTNKSSNCELKRLFCSEEGQIVSSNGTTSRDRECRCNYAHGYTYVTQPKNICSCIPTEEDCSCYRKKCSKTNILSPDYKCIDQFSWSGKIICSSIPYLRSPKVNVSGKEKNTKEVQNDVFRKQRETVTHVFVTITIFLLLTPLIVFTSMFYKTKDKSCSEHHRTISLKNIKYVDENKAEMQHHINENVTIPRKAESKEIKEISGSDSQLKEKFELEINLDSFVVPNVIAEVTKKLHSQNCILLWGKPRCGKTISLHYIAVYLKNRFGYEPVHCFKPSDIFNPQYKKGKRTFVFDDICGRFVFSHERFCAWKRRRKHIERLLQSGNVKLLMTCSSAVFTSDIVHHFSLFTDNAFQLTTPPILDVDMHTSDIELRNNAKLTSPIEQRVLQKVPLPVTKLGLSLPARDSSAYVISSSDNCISDVDELLKSNASAFYSLCICILHKGRIEETMLTSDDHRLFTKISSSFCFTVRINISRRQFLDNLYFLMDKFILKEQGSFYIKHTVLFEELVVYYADKMQKVFLRFADPEIITQHCNLKSCKNIAGSARFIIQVNEENEDMYLRRITEQILDKNISEVCSIRQMSLFSYRNKLVQFLKKLGPAVVKQISLSKCKINNETFLSMAMRDGYVNIIKLFFDYNKDLNPDNHEYLEIACKTDNLPFVKLLANKGININKRMANDCTALHIACKKGSLNLVNYLIRQSADLNCKDKHGNTPLFEACKQENKEIVSLLLKNRADINKSNIEGHSPLMIATMHERTRIVDLLILNKADVNKFDNLGYTCLMHSIQSETKNIEVMLTLLAAGVDVSCSSANEETALIIAIQEQTKEIVLILTDYATSEKGLESAYANIINKCDNRGITPLMHACELRNDNFDVVEHLLSKGAIVNCCDNDERTPLSIALENEDIKLFECLIINGAQVDSPGNKRTTPLHEMCKSGQENNVLLLLSAGSAINIVDRQNMTPLMIASKCGYLEIAQDLIKRNASIDNADHNGTTALMLACIGGFGDVIRFLVEMGADVNKADKNNWTALLAFANSNNDNAEVVNVLINRGADLNFLTNDKVSSLMMASFHGHHEIVKCLLQHNVDVNHKDIYGKTAIVSACLSGNIDIVRVLLEFGADTEVIDENGDTLESLARKNNLIEMINFFSQQ